MAPSSSENVAIHDTPLQHNISDIKLASIALGLTLGFGFMTTWEAMKQTLRARAPLRSVYIWMVWGEILANTLLATMAYLLLSGVVQINLPVLLTLVTSWVLELQFLMQIIINRLAVVISDKRKATKLKWITAAIVTCINISVYCIWVPARLKVNTQYILLNNIWDRIEKVLILSIDAGLNWYFIKVVKERLVQQGLRKYDALVKFNVRIIMVSLSMDALIIAGMSLKNGIVYVQLHPLAYTIKLGIELSMARLITKIAQDKADVKLTTSRFSRSGFGKGDTRQQTSKVDPGTIQTTRDVIVESESIMMDDVESYGSGRNITKTAESCESDMGEDSTATRAHHIDKGPWDGSGGNTTIVQATPMG